MNAHPVPPPEPDPKPKHYEFLIEPWSFRMQGRVLLWFVPGFTHYHGHPN